MDAGLDPAAPTEQLPLEVEEWLTWLAVDRGRAASTLTAYRRDIRGWWRWLRARGTTDLPAVAEADIQAYVGELRGSGRVVAQSPEPGAEIEPGLTCLLTLGREAQP